VTLWQHSVLALLCLRGSRRLSFLDKILYLEILTEISSALDFCENIQSGRVFHTDSNDIEIVGLSQLGSGADTKRPRTGSHFSCPRLRK